MSKPIKCTIELIQSSRDAIAAATAESSRCEAALAKAESVAAKATEDDGELSPEQLFQRGEDARRNLFLRKTEAKRAAEKLAEREAEYHVLLKGGAVPLMDALHKQMQEASASLKEKLSPFVATGDYFEKSALDTFILRCDEVRERQYAISTLQSGIDFSDRHGGVQDNFAESIETALKLLSR